MRQKDELTNNEEKKMKKYFLALALMCATMLPTAAVAQTNTAGNITAGADTTRQDEVEVFSDTTRADTSGTTTIAYGNFPFDDDEDFSTGSLTDSILKDKWGINELAGMGFVLIVLLILFVIAPVLIIGLIFYFIHKGRRDRIRLAEMAMKSGQPIPQELVEKPADIDDELRMKGIRQVFLGIGLACFLGWTIGEVGAGIGILVLCIGLGNLVIARNAKKKREELHADDFDEPRRDVTQP